MLEFFPYGGTAKSSQRSWKYNENALCRLCSIVDSNEFTVYDINNLIKLFIWLSSVVLVCSAGSWLDNVEECTASMAGRMYNGNHQNRNEHRATTTKNKNRKTKIKQRNIFVFYHCVNRRVLVIWCTAIYKDVHKMNMHIEVDERK